MNEQQHPKRNNTCLDAGQLIAWRDGALPLRETDEITAHLAGCARCAAEERALTRDRHQVFDLLSRLDPAPNTHAEPAIALTHFRERLAAQNTASLLQRSDGDIHPGALPPSRSEREDALLPPVRPSIRRHHLAQALVAALVIAALLGTILLLLRPSLPSIGGHPRQAPTAPPIGQVGTPVTVRTQARGLEMTIQITPGPYFLSEMLAADLSLANHTQTTFLLQGTLDVYQKCHAPLKFVMTGGEIPSDPNLESNLAAFPCTGSGGTVQLLPLETIRVRRYIALTSNGQVTLTAQATFQKTALQDGVIQIVPTAGPLDGHWPFLQIAVQARVPSDRVIFLHRQSTQVIVDAPPAVHGQLLYMSVFGCDLGKGGTQHGGTDYWIRLPTMTIQPDCGFSVSLGTATPDKLLRWTYVVGAPGYVMVSGKYP
jgi:hypothetical protein